MTSFMFENRWNAIKTIWTMKVDREFYCDLFPGLYQEEAN